MEGTGFVAIALAGLWIAYLVPQRLRYRQQLLDSCVEDRFSGELRVLRVAGARPVAGDGRDEGHDAVRSTGPIHAIGPWAGSRAVERSGRAVRPPVARERGGRTMDRPHVGRDRAVADAARRTASQHAARAAYLARRAAAARRRAALTGVLLVAVVVGWGAAGLGSAGVVAGAVPTGLLAGVLLLGRRAVVAGARADARWAAGEGATVPVADAVRAARARSASGSVVVGRAVHPSDATTEVMGRVGERRRGVGEASAVSEPAAEPVSVPVAEVSETDEGSAAAIPSVDRASAEPEATSTWVPVPVPRPAYTLKPMARRPEPAPLVLDEVTVETSAASGTAAPDAGDADEAPTTGGLDLDTILARRRAAGE